jgi:hypothetical protein
VTKVVGVFVRFFVRRFTHTSIVFVNVSGPARERSGGLIAHNTSWHLATGLYRLRCHAPDVNTSRR